MRWFGTVYTPMMAVLGLLFIVLSFFYEPETDPAKMSADSMMTPHTMMNAGAVLAAGACIAGALRSKGD